MLSSEERLAARKAKNLSTPATEPQGYVDGLEAVAQMVADLRGGVHSMGMHEDNNTELFDVDGAGDTMFAAADMLTTLAAENATLRAENDIWTERATDAELNWANCTRLAQRLRASEAAALERVKVLTKAMNGCVAAIEHADMSDGVCCCGDNMENHSEPMNCGHSPVDAGEYHAHQVLTAARDAISLPIGTATEKTNG